MPGQVGARLLVGGGFEVTCRVHPDFTKVVANHRAADEAVNEHLDAEHPGWKQERAQSDRDILDDRPHGKAAFNP